MRRIKSILAIVTALAMLFALDSIGAYASNGVNDQDQVSPAEEVQVLQEDEVPVDEDIYTDEKALAEEFVVEENAEEGANLQEEGVVEDDATMELAAIADPVVKPKAPKVTALRGYKSIRLKWKKVPNADAYNVGFKNSKGKWVSKGVTKNFHMDIEGLKAEKNYNFRVMAVQIHSDAKNKKKLQVSDINGIVKNGKWKGGVSNPTYVKKKQCVRRMFIKITKKSNGKRYKSYNYSGGRYYYKGGSVSRVGAKNQKANYIHRGGWNYSKAEAEYFINGYIKKNKLPTKNKTLIWVSSYTQHLYVLKKKNGKWKATGHNWEVSMGKASTPSPGGEKKIHKKFKNRHGLRNWSCYSSLNSFHEYGNLSGKLGNLASHGCIRCPNYGAKWIHNNVPIGTRVLVF